MTQCQVRYKKPAVLKSRDILDVSCFRREGLATTKMVFRCFRGVKTRVNPDTGIHGRSDQKLEI